MTTKEKQLIETYIRNEVRKRLKEQKLSEEISPMRTRVRGTSYDVGLETDGSFFIADNGEMVCRLINKKQFVEFLATCAKYKNQVGTPLDI